MTENERRQFIETIAPIIVKYAGLMGYKTPSAIIAQACLESAFGGSSLAYKYHNYFGLKCGSGWNGASVNMKTNEEYTPGTLTSIRDNFRAYPNMEEGVKGYFNFIQYPRYRNLKTADTPEEYLQMIKNDGYATSSTYVSSNIAVVNKYNLRAYDIKPRIDTSKYPTIRRGERGAWAKLLQQGLIALGYDVGPWMNDGVFGDSTQRAVEDFQSDHGLDADGVVGPLTWAAIFK